MKLSIITVNFNNHDGLQRTIDSVVCQTWRDFEWIIIDGGSTDGSKELIEQYQAHFAYWCSEPDKGIYNAMNKGIDRAKGEWINFMNSGDYLSDKDVLKNVFASQIYSHLDRILLGNTILHYPFGYFLMTSIDKWGFTDFCHQSSFFRTEDVKRYKFNEVYRYVADRDMLLKIQSGVNEITHIPVTIAVYDANNGLSTNVMAVLKESWTMEGKKKGKVYYTWLIKESLKNFCNRFLSSKKLMQKKEELIRSKYEEIDYLGL